jgi:hypothetical protein
VKVFLDGTMPVGIRSTEDPCQRHSLTNGVKSVDWGTGRSPVQPKLRSSRPRPINWPPRPVAQ